jgi:ferrochelatase
MRYASSPDVTRDTAERIGILLVNSGTPHAPAAGAVRAFLARFLADPRVVELPRANTGASGRSAARPCVS